MTGMYTPYFPFILLILSFRNKMLRRNCLILPVGGWLMGAYADRKGRKAALTLSVLLMSGGSLLITFVPGYNSIGIAAPIILVVARMVQGLSVGGEYGTVATYLSEIAPPKRRGLYSSLQYVTTTMGQLL